ncbi:MAG: ral nucleoside transport system ATP-binding protein [Clostridiales bacterium]|nr:ral nucleoside transport system ATP-binding protein [Clostridiales bacterium]
MEKQRNVDMGTVVIQMKDIVKKFGNFVANDGVNLTVHKGEVHAILGENGAGKSTLMNVLYGLYRPTAGEILVGGKKVEIDSPKKAIELGIGMVHQHFMLVQPFTVTENIILGMEPKKGLTVDLKKAREEVRAISEKYNLQIDVDAKVEDISVGMQQRVEILKVLYRGADILILDEPTASLTPQEIEELIDIIGNLTRDGKSVILITHKLKEIKASADYCTIIRRGKYIDTVDVNEVDENELASMMVGRNVEFVVDKKELAPGEDVLVVKDLHAKDYRGIEILRGFNINVRKGEIVGIAGIDGNGQSELVEILTGLKKADSGQVTIHGENIFNASPRAIFEKGVSSIPEDRQKHGLVLDFTVAENMILQNFSEERFSKHGVLKRGAISEFTNELIEKFDVRPNDCENKFAKQLSGGNQQKVIIAREVTNDKDLLIAVNPTRGLDVGAIEFVHKYIVDQRNKNKAVLLVSFELDEIMSLSDRIDVIYDGAIVGEVKQGEADENTLGLLMAGGGVKHEK